MMDERNDRIWVHPEICPDQRGMIQFVLNKDVEHFVIRRLLCRCFSAPRKDTGLRKPEPEIIRQMCGVIPPGQGNDLNRVALRAQIFNQFAVIQIPAADGLERAVGDKSYDHFCRVTLGKAKSLDHSAKMLRRLKALRMTHPGAPPGTPPTRTRSPTAPLSKRRYSLI